MRSARGTEGLGQHREGLQQREQWFGRQFLPPFFSTTGSTTNFAPAAIDAEDAVSWEGVLLSMQPDPDYDRAVGLGWRAGTAPDDWHEEVLHDAFVHKQQRLR
jgi:hypothetical protein